jgi:DNA-nicking Smr family endonuclease
LWKRVAEQVTPLKRRGKAPTPVFPPAQPQRPLAAPQPRPAAPRPVHPAPRPAPELRANSAPGLDGSTHDKLKRGQLLIDGKLDLHGMDRERAHRALGRFLENAAMHGKRCVLVVTGKGGAKPGEAGILKSEVPRWLNEPALRPLVLAFTAAQARHGGAGALYIYLKRRR